MGIKLETGVVWLHKSCHSLPWCREITTRTVTGVPEIYDGVVIAYTTGGPTQRVWYRLRSDGLTPTGDNTRNPLTIIHGRPTGPPRACRPRRVAHRALSMLIHRRLKRWSSWRRSLSILLRKLVHSC